jgi:Subtilase family
MPPIKNPFPHLPLILRYDGTARHPQLKIPADPRLKLAQGDRPAHSGSLNTSASTVTTAWKLRVAGREQANLPVLPKNVPLLLEVDTMLDLDDLRKFFDFEVVSEQEDGFVIVAAADLDLNVFLSKLKDFTREVTGSASVAKIYKLQADVDQSMRLARILSERLLEAWPNLAVDGDYIVDVGVACAGEIQIPSRPNQPNRGKRESDKTWAKREAHYATRMKEWSDARNEAYTAWDKLSEERNEQILGFVTAYGGELLGQFNVPHSDLSLAEDFTLRIRIKGAGLRDLVLNYPFLFEVVEPDDISLPQTFREAIDRAKDEMNIVPPHDDAPAVCVIDSGIQEQHYLLEAAIDAGSSRCFLPGVSLTDIADYVRPSGHGTRVAGAILYGESIPRSGVHELSWWLQNARVLDSVGSMPERLFPPALLQAIVRHYHNGPRSTRIFNHSINASTPCRTRHMSAWAAEIDLLSHRHDVLFVVSSGNIKTSGTATTPGILEHLNAGREYPGYLRETSSRVANPAQSLQALTVGSISYRDYEDPDWQSCARGVGYPSAFSRSGLGIWNSIKPELVELGGDSLVSQTTPRSVGTPECGRDCYPELVCSTMYPPSPAYERDAVGTSFATAKVTRIASRLQEVLPDESCLLYRALIVQSARWPDWTKNASPAQRGNIARSIGYGIPDIERATMNTEYRTTLVTSGDRAIKAGSCHIFQVPIHEELRRPRHDFDILIEVTLSYAAEPRRTRRSRRRYLSTWIDWKSSHKDEPLESFRRRALKSEEDVDDDGTSFRWTIGTNPLYGTVREVSRNAGTVQKDWTVVKSNSLPEDFCIAVVGHQGWSKDPDSAAIYTLAVSMEVVGKELPIYEHVRVSVETLQAEVEAESEVEVELLGS